MNEVEGYTKRANKTFSVFEAFSFLLDDGLARGHSQQTMTTLQHTNPNGLHMSKDRTFHKKVNEEIAKFEKTMEELRLLKCVSEDLRSYRKMIRIKKND